MSVETGSSGRFVEKVRDFFGRFRRGGRTQRGVQEPQDRPEPQPEVPTPQTEAKPETLSGMKKDIAREAQRLNEVYGDDNFQILPRDKWALHHQNGPEAKKRAIEGLLSGQMDPTAEIVNLTPDALLYNQDDLETHGVDQVEQQIMDAVTTVKNYDYEKFADFISSMHGTDISPEEAENIYTMIASDRAREAMLDSYDAPNRQRIINGMRQQQQHLQSSLPHVTGMDHQLTESRIRHYETHPDVGRSNRENDDLMQKVYQDYIRNGDETAYQSLVSMIHDYYANADRDQEQTEDNQQGDQDPQFGQEQSPQQQEISSPPEASDEYTQPTETPTTAPFFEIRPTGTSTRALLGYYASERHTKYDITTKTWSHQKELQSYSGTSNTTDKQQITGRGRPDASLIALPIPADQSADLNSLSYTGVRPDIMRDKTGCFYLTKADDNEYRVDFFKDASILHSVPTPEDSEQMYTGTLSVEAEELIHSLQGTETEKSNAILEYIRSKHVYPDDSDEAGQIQDMIRNNSIGNNYIQNLEASHKLECYSANTLFAAMCRKSGIPTRLVIGDMISESKNGVAQIDSTTAHAWSEIWNGKVWERKDATPPSQNPQEDNEAGEPGEEQDQSEQERTDAPQQEQGEQSRQRGQEFGSSLSSFDSFLPQDLATDEEKEQGEKSIEEAQDVVQEALERQRELSQKVDNLNSFQDIKDLRDKLNESEIFDDMKEELEKMLDSVENQKKEELKEKLDKMQEEGFLDEAKREALEHQLEEGETENLDAVVDRMNRESGAYERYESIVQFINPLIDEYYPAFIALFPPEEEIVLDEESYSENGELNEDWLTEPGNIEVNEVFNRRNLNPEIDPKVLTRVYIDVSGSMAGRNIQNAEVLTVFCNELFSRAEKEFPNFRYSLMTYSDSIKPVKSFEQNYADNERYDYGTGTPMTVKAYMMEAIRTEGGTNMHDAMRQADEELAREAEGYDHPLTMATFIGDGEDSRVNATTNSRLVEEMSENHMISAIMLGDESQKRVLEAIFGEHRTAVAQDIHTLIEIFMQQQMENIHEYLRPQSG